MSQLVVDAQMKALLERVKEATDLVAEDGRKLGRFVPEPAAAEPFCPWDPTLTREEAERIANETEGYTLDEILQELEGR